MGFFEQYFETVSTHLMSADDKQLRSAVDLLRSVTRTKSKVIVAGNGGSASMASHVSVDLTKVAHVRAVNFNEPDLLTCFANDFGYEHWVDKALEYYADTNDVVILISSSGQSRNMVNGALKAKALRLSLITLSGFEADNPLRKIGDINFWVNSHDYNIVEMVHHVWLLAIVDRIIHDKHQSVAAASNP